MAMRPSCSPVASPLSVAFALTAVISVLWPAALGAAEPVPPPGTRVTGAARVVDGDTIVIDNLRIRLEGIDAPESGQTCQRKWVGAWACGTVATTALARMLDGRAVTCESRGPDKYNRMLGICFADGHDVNARMVREGHAWAFVKYSKRYVAEEAAARSESAGIWQGASVPAWEYRAQQWASAEDRAPVDGCVIKGNVTRNGRIYHMPWSPWYQRVRIDADPAKRWFCSETEAVAAGWRPAYIR